MINIRARLSLINGGYVFFVLFLSALSLFQLFTLDRIHVKSVEIASALRSQGEADMMHDGLRADVLYAIKVAGENNAAARQEALKNTNEHADHFRNLIAQVKELNISERVNETLEALDQPLDVYIKSAQTLTRDAFENPSAVDAEYKKFQEDFEYLEGAMADFSSVIENEFEHINSEVEAEQKQITLCVIFFAFLSLAMGGYVWVSSQMNIMGPLKKLERATQRLAAGDLETEIAPFKNKDEIGAVGDAMIILRDNLIKARDLEELQKEEQRQKLEFAEKLTKMTGAFDKEVSHFIRDLSASTRELSVTASSLAEISTQGKNKAGELKNASSVAAQNVSTVAGASEEMSASIREISTQILGASKASMQAVEKSNQAGLVINELKGTSASIGEVVVLIQDIAEQTNLLALNATIEAARAGDAGKGFAVVANEVKSLAMQTGKATENIAAQVSAMQSATENAVKVIGLVGQEINRINEIATTISAAMEQQSAAVSEIVRNTQSASDKTEQVGGIVENVAAGAQETEEASSNVSDSAMELSRRTEELRGVVELFLSNLKAA